MRISRRENKQINKKAVFLLILLGMVALVLLTRAVSLTHGISIHPDEHTFVSSASSAVFPHASEAAASDNLAAVAQDELIYEYTPERNNYPEGAFIFQIPVQLLCRVIGAGTGMEISPVVAGRIAGMIYFLLAGVLGLRLVYIKSNRNLLASLFFAAIMVFSLFHMEQSRYGTGDPITVFVLMAVLIVLEIYSRELDGFYLYFAAFLVGALGAIKYPLIAFIALPLAALAIIRTGKSRLKGVLLTVLFAAVGLIVFTPSVFTDPGVFMRTLFVEFDSYVVGGNYVHAGSPLANILSLLIFWLVYADVPLAPLFIAAGLVWLHRKGKEAGTPDRFFSFWIPLFTGILLVVNLLPTTFIFRSLYPYLFVGNLYAAIGMAALFTKRPVQIAITALLAFMVVRGGIFTYTLSQPSSEQRAKALMTSHEKWDERTVTNVFYPGLYVNSLDIPPKVYILKNFEALGLAGANLGGQFMITDATGYIAPYRLFNIGQSDMSRATGQQWESYLSQHEGDLIGTGLLGYEKPLFGTWLHGSSLNTFEFPENYVFYFAEGAPAEDLDRRLKYDALYALPNAKYLAAIGAMEDISILAVSLSAGEGAVSPGDLPGLYTLPEEASAAAFIWSGGTVLAENLGAEIPYWEAALPNGTRCQLTASPLGISNIIVDGKTYTPPKDAVNGYFLVVYDEQYGAVMDWRAISG